MRIKHLIPLLLLCSYAATVYSNDNHLRSCRSSYGKSGNLQLQRPPQRVLLVPLLSKEPHSTESPRWSEQPARILAAFYRKRFHAKVTQLRDVWSWDDYYRQVEPIQQQKRPFDRVIFISHGGFDGPVLNNAVFWQDFQISADKGTLQQLSESQPGLENALSITYDPQKNRLFSDYMATRRGELKDLKSSTIWRRLKDLEKQIQPLDQACFKQYCSPIQLTTSPVQQHAYRLQLCEQICREPLFEQKVSVAISPERFSHFAESMTSLTSEDGLIFFGACNPGSAAPIKMVEKDETGLLINSPLVGGPYNSYVHLVSAATGRISAGPVGSSSAKDIVNRIVMFENGRSQKYLCIVAPATH